MHCLARGTIIPTLLVILVLLKTLTHTFCLSSHTDISLQVMCVCVRVCTKQMMSRLNLTLEVLEVSPLVCNSPLAAVGVCAMMGRRDCCSAGGREILLRQGGNVRGTDSLDMLADSRVQSVFDSHCAASSFPHPT